MATYLGIPVSLPPYPDEELHDAIKPLVEAGKKVESVGNIMMDVTENVTGDRKRIKVLLKHLEVLPK